MSSPVAPASPAPPSPAPAAEAAAGFEALVTPHLRAAYATAYHLTRNAADAEDAVQEAALNALRAFHTFEPGSNFRAWFFRIVVNVVYGRFRRTKRQGSAVELEDTPELYLYCQTAAAGLHGLVEDPATALMNKLDREAVHDAIATLPDEYRMAATLYFVDDFSYQEIAEMLGCPVGTVRSRLHRGRRLLQRALWRVAEARGIAAELVAAAREGRAG